MKLKSLAVVVQTDNDEVYQVALTKEELLSIESLIKIIQDGSIKILPHKLDGIILTNGQSAIPPRLP